jgi:RimJ/RimL family protein N-acetyltransferase
MMVLETGRLTLRPIAPSDRERLVRHIGDWEVARWLSRVPHPYDAAAADAWLALRASAPADDDFWVLDDGSGLIGAIGLHAPKAESGTGPGARREIGYWLARPWWGRGLMSEAAGAVVDHAFEALALSAVTSGHFDGNHGSRRILEKLGFEVTGHAPLHSLSHGEALPHTELALTRAAWAARTGRAEGSRQEEASREGAA